MASKDTPKQIFLKGCPFGKEAAGAAAITPGMLLGFNADGEAIPHGTAGGTAVPEFARPNEVVGNGIDTDYASGETVLYGVSSSGHEVYALLAAGDNVDPSNFLESAGDGTFTAVDTGTALVRPVEAVDNSGGASPVRIKVEVL